MKRRKTTENLAQALQGGSETRRQGTEFPIKLKYLFSVCDNFPFFQLFQVWLVFSQPTQFVTNPLFYLSVNPLYNVHFLSIVYHLCVALVCCICAIRCILGLNKLLQIS